MKKLSETWFAEGFIDFEQKKYTLLAYLQQVNKHFGENKLYPQLGDLIFHFNNLLQFKRNKAYLQQQFPKRLTGMDMQRIEMLYQSMIDDGELMKEMEDIIAYALRNMKNCIEDGTVIYELVEGQLEIEPVGIVPADVSEGYFLLRDVANTEAHVFQYRMSMFERHNETYRTLSTQFVSTWRMSFTVSPESIKREMLKQWQTLSMPAFYTIASRLSMPVEETLLPVAKRTLARYIATEASSSSSRNV